MTPVELQTQGLVWVQKTFHLEPQWTVEPDLEAIRQTIQSLLKSGTIQSLQPSSAVQVTFLAQGAFNKIYDVNIDNETFIMRVSLPVDPYYKTMSEVSTLGWISRITNIPVPQIIAYQSSRENPIGFEWIAMTKMPGRPLKERWRFLPFSAKISLVGQFAVYSACLFRNQLQGIGNIYSTRFTLGDSTLAAATWPAEKSACSNESPSSGVKCSSEVSPEVGRIVSKHFFWGSNLHRDVHRGPFASSRDWITSRLTLHEKECQSTLDNLPSGELGSDDEDELDDATRTLKIVRKLQVLLPSVFPPTGDKPEPSIMLHDDLSSQNIIVNDSGDLAAVLDWECVSAVPLWIACYYPSFLQGPPRSVKPNPEEYETEENGEPCELYWEHLAHHEMTLLRDVFIERMKSLEPGWVHVFNQSQRERDFQLALQSCDNEWLARDILAWIDDLTSGVDNPQSLWDR